MYALVDCNNFYVSCERLFRPQLENKPVIVLSNNDGCAISRSEEAKQAGVKMGMPEFMIRDIISQNKVYLFSSNYTLYADLSNRVMSTLSEMIPRLEIYSIDEAFLDMHNMDYSNLYELGIKIKTTVKQNTGIPVSVGIALTKTLAKMANRYAKKLHRDKGVFAADNESAVKEMLQFTEVGDIWGVGGQYAAFLKNNGFNTAYDLSKAPEEFMRKNMTVQGQRLLKELNGIPAIEWEFERPDKKNICTSKSFGSLQTDKKVIAEAVSNYASLCAMKLRQQKSCCKKLHVFLHTNIHRKQDRQYSPAINIDLSIASNLSNELIKYALKGFEMIFKPGYNYLKCGVIVSDFVPENVIQTNLFLENDRTKQATLNKALDSINKSMGKEKLRFAVQGYEKKYRLRADYLSQCYTTNIKEVLRVKN